MTPYRGRHLRHDGCYPYRRIKEAADGSAILGLYTTGVYESDEQTVPGGAGHQGRQYAPGLYLGSVGVLSDIAG